MDEKDTEEDVQPVEDDENQHEDDQNQQENSENDSKSSISADLIRGHINTIILRTLYDEDKYGYEIINEIEEKSHGQYSLKQPTLYSALKRLESQGYIKAYWKTDEVTLGGRRKYFTLTESGKEVTEKNQAEWEFSRSVIDNLISTKTFDFSQPAPTPVDFSLLKNSVSRIPSSGRQATDETAEKAENAEAKNQEVTEKAEQQSPSQIIENNQPAQAQQQTVYDQAVQPQQAINTPINQQQTVQQGQATQQNNFVSGVNQANYEQQQINEEQLKAEQERMLAHENYMRLISTPAPQPQYVKSSNGETFNTNNLYNSKPETERDYKNLISNIYNRAIQGSASSYQHQQPVNEQVQQIESVPYSAQSMSMASDKARVDGLKVNVSNTKSSMKNTTIVTTYDLGLTLFKCSAIVGIILFIEFLLCMVFKNGLGVSVAYPIVILMIGVALLAISGVLTLFGFGKNSTKPITNNYISISVVISIIIILIICVIAFLGVTDVNTLSAGNIMAKIVVPSITALTIPLFATSFYLFIK